MKGQYRCRWRTDDEKAAAALDPMATPCSIVRSALFKTYLAAAVLAGLVGDGDKSRN